MIRTALVRNSETKNLKIFRADDYRTQSEMAQDLRGNGYRVLKIWNENKTDSEVENMGEYKDFVKEYKEVKKVVKLWEKFGM